MTRSILRSVALMLLAGFAFGISSASAGTVTVSGEDPNASISVTVENATVADVLAQLREKFDFEVEDLAHAGTDEAFDAKLAGNLADVLQRLLRNRNHVIVRSAEAASGISRVVIINDKIGKAASQTKQDKAALQQIENAKRATGE